MISPKKHHREFIDQMARVLIETLGVDAYRARKMFEDEIYPEKIIKRMDK